MNWRQSTRGAVMFEAALLIALVGTIATLSQIHSTVAQQREFDSVQLAAAAMPDDNAEPPREGYDNRVSVSCPSGSPGGSVAITGSGNVDVLNPNCTGIVQFTDPETGKTISMDTKQFQNITSACNQGTKECDKAFGDAGMGGLKPEDAKGFKNIFDVQASRIQAQREVSDIVGGAFHEGPPAIQQAYQQLAKPDLSAAEISSIRESLDTAGVLTGPVKESMDNLAIKNAQLEQLKDMVADGGVVRLDPTDPYAGGLPATGGVSPDVAGSRRVFSGESASFFDQNDPTGNLVHTVQKERDKEIGLAPADTRGRSTETWGEWASNVFNRPPDQSLRSLVGYEPIRTESAFLGTTETVEGTVTYDRIGDTVVEVVTMPGVTRLTDAGATREYEEALARYNAVTDATPDADIDAASDDLERARDKLAEQGIKFDPRCEEEWEKCNAKGELIGDKPAERGRGIVLADPDKAAEEARKEAVIKAAEAERARAADAERVAKEKAAADEKLKIERLAQERAAELARQRAAQQPPPQTPPRGGILDTLGGLLGGGMSPEQKAQLEAACKSGNTNACMQLANGNQQQNPLQALLGQLGKMLGGGSKGGGSGSGSGGSGSGQQQAQNTNGCSQYPGTTLQNGTCTCPSGQSWSGSACATQNPCATYAGTTYNQQANRCDCPSGQNYDGSRCVAVVTADTLKAELSCAPKPPQVQDVEGPIAISWSCTGAVASKGDKFDTGNEMSGSTEIPAALPQGSASSATITYALTCSKDGVQKVATCVVGVSKPFVALAATPSETTSGKTVKLAWVSGGMRDGDDACTITSDELPAFRKTGKSGLADTPNITEETTFDLKCTTKGGLTKEASATVRIR